MNRSKNRKKNEQEGEPKLRQSALLVDFVKEQKSSFHPKFCFPIIQSCGCSPSLLNQRGSCVNSTLKPGISHVHLAFKLREVPLEWINAYTKQFSLEL